MRKSHKPVRKCYTCKLNLLDRCWIYASPRSQWSGKRCRGFENEKAYALLQEWEKDVQVKTRKELRQEIFRKKKTEPHWNHFPMSTAT